MGTAAVGTHRMTLYSFLKVGRAATLCHTAKSESLGRGRVKPSGPTRE